MPASPRTLFWLNTTDANEPFGEASSWTTIEGSSTPATAAPTSIDDTEIDTTATVSGSGSADVLNINAGVTVSGSLNTDVTDRTTIGNSAAGSVTIGTGSSWTLSHELGVGDADNGQLTISGGGSLTTDTAISGTSYDGIGGAGTGSVTVTGAGSKWTSNAASSLAIAAKGTLSVTDGGEVQQTQAANNGGFFLAGGSMSVDSSSIAEAGTVGGAQAGYFTIDPNGWSGGVGTINANIVDNGDLAASDAAGFQGNGTLTINGSVTGTGSVTVGAQETLALNGSVSLTRQRVGRFLRLVRHARDRRRSGFLLDHAHLQFHARRHDRPQERALCFGRFELQLHLWLERRAERSQDHGGRAHLQLECRDVL